jgi:hypothetical protein
VKWKGGSAHIVYLKHMDWAYCPMTTTTAFTAFTSYASTPRVLVVRDVGAVADVVTTRRALEELITFLDLE